MALYVGNKKYSVVRNINTATKDINITQNGRYLPSDFGNYGGFNVVEVNIPAPNLQTKYVTPTAAQQTITPSSGYDGLSQVIVYATPSTVDSDIIPSNIKKGVNILGVVGTLELIQDEITIEPSVEPQIIYPISGHSGYSKISVNRVTNDIDSDIIPENIRVGKNILGVVGTLKESKETTIRLTQNGVFTPGSQYTGYSEVTVDIPLETITITPTLASQTIVHPSNGGYSRIVVEPVTASIDPDIIPSNIKQGINILGVEGVLELEDIIITPKITQEVYTTNKTGFNTITVLPVTASIDPNIIPSNILTGVTILGVTGNVQFETKTIYPSTIDKTYTPLQSGFSEVTVKGVTSAIDANIVASNIKRGVTILGVEGNFGADLEELVITPRMESQVFVAETIDGWNKVTVAAVPAEIDVDISAANIREGITILGVTGTLIELVGEEVNMQLTTPEQITILPSGANNAITSLTIQANNYDYIVEPSTAARVVSIPQDYSGFGELTINPVTAAIDTNIVPNNIRNGVTVLGVQGTLVELVGQTKTIRTNGTYTPDTGYNAFTEVVVDINTVRNQDLYIAPSTQIQQFIISSDSEYTGYNNIFVEPVNALIDEYIRPENIKEGITILNIEGEVIELAGEERIESLTSIQPEEFTPNDGYNAITSIIVSPTNQDLTIEPSTQDRILTVPQNYSGYGTLTINGVTSSIDANITPENIATGVTILGVQGSAILTNLKHLDIYENGTYTPEAPYNGFDSVYVDINTVNNTTLSVVPQTTTQVYTPPTPYTGFSEVTVVGSPTQSKTLTIDENTQTITTIYPDNGYTGLSSVTVDLTAVEDALIGVNGSTVIGTETPILQNLTIVENGTFTPDLGYDGFSEVTVSVGNSTLSKMISGTASSVETDAATVRSYAFYHSTNLTSVTLNKAQTIGENAFAYTNLTNLTIKTQSLCSLTNTNAFTSTLIESLTGHIYVPANLVDTYKAATNWSAYASIIEAIS